MKFDNPRFVGAGTYALIYAVELNGREYAVKLHQQSGDVAPNELVQEISDAREEFAHLTKLDGIRGIPRAHAVIPGKFSLEELGLSRPDGYEGNGVVYSPILMDYFEGAKQLAQAGDQSSYFFDRLEKIVEQVHERGLCLQIDFGCLNILSQNGRPVVVDWLLTQDLPSDETQRKAVCERDIQRVCSQREKYQREEFK
ncbi:hypothetical protein GOV10_02860 [Candidatus Woesearchaeota archaeon]|nr:hypothetical protein [Candidatus Woesearchaeota archaeon]